MTRYLYKSSKDINITERSTKKKNPNLLKTFTRSFFNPAPPG